MRYSTLFGAAVLVTAVCFAVDANAQGIKIGKLKQLTAPLVGGNLELMAIGYDGDTTESEEKPSLYGFRGQTEIKANTSEVSWAWIETVKPNGDCLDCELRDPKEDMAYSELYADLRRY